MTSTSFTRSQFTISAYAMLGFYAYMQLSLGPIMTFVRDELSLNYTVTGFHSTAFALGMVIAGLTGAAVSKRMGRRHLFWGAGAGMCLAGGLLMVAQVAPLTVLAAFLMGWIGSYLLVMIQSTLADEHSDNSAIALTEANIIAILCAAFVPILVGIGVQLGLTWRFATVFGIGIWVATFLRSRDMTFPTWQIDEESGDSQKRLPRLFWMYWLVIFLGVALEWVIFFWSAEFLNKVVQLSTEQAATVSSVFLFAMLIGRFVGSRLTYRFAPARLLWTATGVLTVGFIMFWLGQVGWINIAGLFIVGLGVSNLFPLGLSLASKAGRHVSDLASARVSLAAGLAIFILPQTLGSTADVVGIFNAFAIVPLFLVLLASTLFAASRQP